MLGGRRIESVEKFGGGQEKRKSWGRVFRTAVQQKSKVMGMLLDYVEKNSEMTWKDSKAGVELGSEYVSLEVEWHKGVEGVAVELHQQLIMATELEAQGLAMSVDEGDGVRAWGKLHAVYKQKTVSRSMRTMKDCLHPKEVQAAEVLKPAFVWEGE